MSNFFRNIHPLLIRKKKRDQSADTNFAVLNALNYELTQAEQETIESKVQSSLEAATGDYLDKWGDWFGVYRKLGWEDDYYRKRIIRYLLLKRGTIPAIIDAILDFLNDYDANVSIYEPWRNIFYLNKSKLNGPDRLMGKYYRSAIIDISIDRPFPPQIIEIINVFKPAGVLFYLRLNDSMNPNKEIIPMPVSDIDAKTWRAMERWSGINWDVAGQMNLGDTLSKVNNSDIFYTNRSLLNGPDVLAGNFAHGRETIHVGSITDEDFTPSIDDEKPDVANKIPEDTGLSLYTNKIDGLGAKVPTEDKKESYLYQVLDVYTFLEEKYSQEVKEFSKVRQDPETMKNTIQRVMDESSVAYTVRAMTGPQNPMDIAIEIYDFASEEWQTLDEVQASGWWQSGNVELGQILDYVSDFYLIYMRVKGFGLEEASSFEVDYLALTFSSRLGTGYGITSYIETEDEYYTPAKGVELYQDLIEIGIGETFNLEAKPIPESATPQDYEWSSSNNGVVSVSEEGKIEGKGRGQAKIEVYLDDKEFMDEIQVQVVQRAEEVNFEPEELTFDV